MKESRIVINLPNGDSLVAEACPYNGGQIAIGIVRDEMWVQDLAVVETDNEDGKYVEDKYKVYVYGSEYDECFTDRFDINRTKSDAL